MAGSGLGAGEMANVASLLQQPADSFGNDPTMEMQWAMKAFHHAETYFKLISAVDPTLLKLTRIDDDIYTMFRKEFPDLNVKVVDENAMKSPEGKAQWREFLNQFEQKVEDWNMGTLLRLDAMQDITDSNTTLVPRVQFLAIEIARNREGINREALHTPKPEQS